MLSLEEFVHCLYTDCYQRVEGNLCKRSCNVTGTVPYAYTNRKIIPIRDILAMAEVATALIKYCRV